VAGRVIDISPPVGRDTIVWPGDTPYSLETAWSPESGDAVTVSRVKGKQKRFGRLMGRRNNWKKAYVRLAEGQEINFAATE